VHEPAFKEIGEGFVVRLILTAGLRVNAGKIFVPDQFVHTAIRTEILLNRA